MGSWQQAFEITVKANDMLALMEGRSCQPGIGYVIGGERLVGAQFAHTGHSAPNTGSSTPGADNRASTKRRASVIGVGWMNIFGCVTKRKKLAITMGCSFSVAP